jgi:hypothetical protein
MCRKSIWIIIESTEKVKRYRFGKPVIKVFFDASTEAAFKSGGRKRGTVV